MKSVAFTIKKSIRDLSFDRHLVRKIKKSNVDQGHLYQQLMLGRITLQEYLQAS